jgi:hypothetical protein
MTTYFSVSVVEAPTVAYEEHTPTGEVIYLDASGATVNVMAFPLHYVARQWSPNTTETWMLPAPVPENIPERIITTKAFLLRFTGEERVAVRTAARASVAIDDWLHLLESDVIVHLDSLFMADGIHALIGAGFITDARAKEILGAEIQPFEVPNA